MESYFMIKPDGMNKTIKSEEFRFFLYSLANYLSGLDLFKVDEQYLYTAHQASVHAYERSLTEKSFQGKLVLSDASIDRIHACFTNKKISFLDAVENIFYIFDINIIRTVEKRIEITDIEKLYRKVNKIIYNQLVKYLNNEYVRIYKLNCEVYMLQHIKTFIRHFFGESNNGYQLRNLVHVFDIDDIWYAQEIFKED